MAPIIAQGIIAGLARKTRHKAPLEAVPDLQIVTTGIVGNVPQGVRRRITLMSLEAWTRVQQELGQEVPWTTRRANILVEGVRLGDTIGKQIRINEVLLQVHGETEPCAEMDRYCPGLREALIPECRGGVYASVIAPGTVHTGDAIHIL